MLKNHEHVKRNIGTQEHKNTGICWNMLEHARTPEHAGLPQVVKKNLINKTKTSTYHSPCWNLNTPTARLLVNQDGGLDARRTQATHKFSFNSFIIILNFFKSNCMLIFIF